MKIGGHNAKVQNHRRLAVHASDRLIPIKPGVRKITISRQIILPIASPAAEPLNNELGGAMKGRTSKIPAADFQNPALARRSTSLFITPARLAFHHR